MTFTNDLDDEIILREITEENKYIERITRANIKKSCIYIATILSGSLACTITQNPKYVIAGLATAGGVYLIDKTKNLITQRIIDAQNMRDLKNGNINSIKRRNKQNHQKYRLEHPSAFYKKDNQDIEEEIDALILEGPFPMAIFDSEKTTERLLHEYELYNRKYDLPKKTFYYDELLIFVIEIQKTLEKKGLPHRLYTYLTSYFKYILVKCLVIYKEDFSLEDLIDSIDLFTNIDYLPEEIEELKNNIRNKLNQEHRLTKNRK